MEFKNWLEKIYNKKKGGNISLRSVDKYINAVKVVNKEMLEKNVIEKSIYEMDIIELDIAIEKIFGNSIFQNKNKKGNNMYSCALKRYRCYKHYTNTEELIIDNESDRNKNTEREQVVSARIGQQEFKRKLLDKYNDKCIITELSVRPALIASHIKPWAVSNNDERVDVNNGLLLSATYDRLFDSGLITFNKDGKIIISNIISPNDLKILNINKNMTFNLKVEGKMKEYLKYHNDVIFVK